MSGNSTPEIDAARAAYLAQLRYRENPVAFCEERLGLHLWSKQREIIESVRDNPRTAVRSSHGVGKTTVAAATVLWFLAAFAPEAVAVTTAPTWDQVKDLLWREIHALRVRAGNFFDGHATEVRLDMGEKWFAYGRSTDRAERFQGYHSPHFLFVADEASGVSEDMFHAAEGFLTAGDPRVLLIGNPTQVGGSFYEAFHKTSGLHNRIHVSTFDTPAFTGETVPPDMEAVLPNRRYLDDAKKKHGIPDENERGGHGILLPAEYEIRVLGHFPSQASDAVIPLWMVEEAHRREVDVNDPEQTWPVVVSCDVARFGSDETVIGLARGWNYRTQEVVHGQDTMATVGAILRVARQHHPHPLYGAPMIVVDDVGVGGGVSDRLREIGEFRVVGFSAGEAPAEVNKGADGYRNARDELWFSFREDVLPYLDLDPEDSELQRDLCAPLYRVDSQQRRCVEPKSDTKKRINRSPDRGDACLMAFCRKVRGAIVTAPSEHAFGPPTPGGSRWTALGGTASGGRSKWR